MCCIGPEIRPDLKKYSINLTAGCFLTKTKLCVPHNHNILVWNLAMVKKAFSFSVPSLSSMLRLMKAKCSKNNQKNKNKTIPNPQSASLFRNISLFWWNLGPEKLYLFESSSQPWILCYVDCGNWGSRISVACCVRAAIRNSLLISFANKTLFSVSFWRSPSLCLPLSSALQLMRPTLIDHLTKAFSLEAQQGQELMI